MRTTTLIPALCALLSTTAAYPGMGTTLSQIRARADSDEFDSREVIGDLATLPDDKLTPVGRDVKTLLTGGGNPESSEIYDSRKVPKKDSPECAADTCCIWQYISNDMQAAFRGRSGRCTNLARGAVRLGFHDCAGWSKFTGPGGGCDGSIILAGVEMGRVDNRGLEEIVAQMKTWFGVYSKYGISMADLIQMGATVATVVCPLGPRIKSYVGRVDSNAPATDGLLPPVTGSADFLIEMFQNKTIRPHGLTALIGAHTTSQQRFVDQTRAGDPQDSTPGVWDVLFYKQILGSAPPRVFKFASDVVLSKDKRIADEFKEFAGPGGQKHWNEDYAREYIRLSLLGVFNINDLKECTKALPQAIGAYTAPDQVLVDQWLQSKTQVKAFADALLAGNFLTGLSGLLGQILKGVGF